MPYEYQDGELKWVGEPGSAIIGGDGGGGEVDDDSKWEAEIEAIEDAITQAEAQAEAEAEGQGGGQQNEDADEQLELPDSPDGEGGEDSAAEQSEGDGGSGDGEGEGDSDDEGDNESPNENDLELRIAISDVVCDYWTMESMKHGPKHQINAFTMAVPFGNVQAALEGERDPETLGVDGEYAERIEQLIEEWEKEHPPAADPIQTYSVENGEPKVRPSDPRKIHYDEVPPPPRMTMIDRDDGSRVSVPWPYPNDTFGQYLKRTKMTFPSDAFANHELRHAWKDANIHYAADKRRQERSTPKIIDDDRPVF